MVEQPWYKKKVRESRAALAILWLYLLSPVVLLPLLAGGQYPLDNLYLFNLLATLLWFGLLLSLFRRPAIFHVLALPLYVTTSIDLFLLIHFGARLSSSYFGVIFNDVTETSEFSSTYFWALFPFLLFLLVCYPFLLRACWNVRFRVHLARAALFAVALCGLYAAAATRSVLNGAELGSTVDGVIAKEASAPIGALAQLYSAVQQMVDSAELVRSRKNSKLEVTRSASAETEVYVWVIGESSRPQNWRLYGYGRDTTPRLVRQQGLLVLDDVLTSAPLTAQAVPSMLSLWPINDWDSVLREKSIVSVFHQAGFKTYWLSTQEADGWAGLIPQIANEAGETRFFDHAYDGALLEPLKNIVDGAAEGSKIFIVLHTKGSHFEYSRRYPEEFADFGDGAPSLIDTYDNSIRYTDSVLSDIIDILAQKRYKSALIYVSDHGENLRDDSRRLLGHSIGNEFDLRVPAFIWFSDQFMDVNRDKICRADLNRKQKLSMSDLPHSFLDLLSMSSPAIDRSRSIFSETFVSHPRAYMLNGVVDIYTEKAIANEPRRGTSTTLGCG